MVLKIERFQPEGMNVRMSDGKPSYSHVVTVSGSGKIVYTAGQLARDIDGNCVGKGDMRAQMEQTFQNLDRCLKAAGATWADVVKTNTFVTDFDEFQKCGDIRMRYLGVRNEVRCSPSCIARESAAVALSRIVATEVRTEFAPDSSLEGTGFRTSSTRARSI